MGLKCRISYDSTGTAQVLDSNGNESQLFNQLLAATGNQRTALDYWVVANDTQMMNKEDATIADIVSYLDASSAMDKTLSPAERIQVTDFMQRNGVRTLDDLNSQLATIFKPNGRLGIDTNAAINSGLFTADELSNIDLDQLQDIMLKIEGQLVVDDIVVEPFGIDSGYINTDRTTIFGTKQRVTQEEFDQDLIRAVENFTNRDSFYQGVKTLPYTQFVEKFLQDEQYANEIMDKFKGLKKIPVLSIVNGELSDANNTVYTTVRNTVLTDVDSTPIVADVEYLDSIPQELWNENTEDIQAILREVEEELVKVNIDVVGISERYGDRAKVMDLLVNAYALTQEVSTATIQAFADSHANLFETPGKVVTEKLDERYEGYNIVSLHANMSENQLFERFGLIRIADNMYHNVDQSADINLVRDAIYEGIKRGDITIPDGFITVDMNDILNKPEALEGISRYLMSRPTPVKNENHELYSGYQVVFNHAPVQVKKNDIRGLTELKTDVGYLRGQFISDFYNYILREKVKRSEVYDSVLSKFEINDKDITLKGKIDSIENLEFKDELSDYIRLHKDSNMKYLVDDSSTAISEDLYAINFPETVAEYEGSMIKEDEYVITPPTVSNYIKVDGTLYRKEATKPDAELFVKITTPQHPTYYAGSQNFDFNRDIAVDVLDSFGMMNQEAITQQDFQTVVAKSRINDNMTPSLKELSTLRDKSYTFTGNATSFVAMKDGKEVGRIDFETEENSFDNPVVRVNEDHRGKGIGTELYLNLFDKAWKSGRTVSEPEVETKQSLNIFSRIQGVVRPEVRLQMPEGSPGVQFYNYIPFSFQPNTNSLNKEEFDTMMNDIGKQRIGLIDYLDFVSTMQDEAVYQGIFKKLVEPNLKKMEFTAAQNEILKFEDPNNRDLLKAQKFVSFYEKYRDDFPSWAEENKVFYNDVVRYLSGGRAVRYQADEAISEFEGPKEVTDAVLDRLQRTGLANNVYSMESHEIEAVLNELGISPSIARQVTVWHGTSDPMKDINVIDKRSEKRYGKLLGGTYFASKRVASWFTGWIEYQSKLFEVNLDESSFAVIDMKGSIPNDRIDLLEYTDMTEEEYEKLLAKKESGEIKGLILKNAKEDDVSELHTQYVAFSPDVIEEIQEITGKQAFEEIGKAIGMIDEEVPFQFQQAGVNITPNGFVHDGDVYLNTDSANLMNTQIHEFGHLFNSWAKKNRPDIYNKGIELIQTEDAKPYLDFVKRNQPNLKGERLYEEALTQAIGDQGQRIVEENARQSFKDWLAELWNSLIWSLGLIDMNAEELQSLTLREFARAASIDLMKGGSVETNFQTRDGRKLGFTYNTDMVARKRFDIGSMSKIGEGSDRVTFDMGDGKVLKVAKTARGLEQNIWEGEPLDFLPKVYEKGLNYVVAEKVEPMQMSKELKEGLSKEALKQAVADRKAVRDMIDEFSDFDQGDFNSRTDEIQEVLTNYDMQDMLSYDDVIWGDMLVERNWGIRDGQPIHLDGGTFGGIRMLDKYRGKKDLQDSEFREVYYESRQLKKDFKDTDKFTKFQVTAEAVAEQNVENTASIFNSRLELLDLYTSKEEVQITKDIDCGG